MQISRVKLLLAVAALLLVLLLLVQVSPGLALPETALRAQAFVRLALAILVLAATVVLNPRHLGAEPGPEVGIAQYLPLDATVTRSCILRC